MSCIRHRSENGVLALVSRAWLLCLVFGFFAGFANATPVTFYTSHAGNLNYVATGGTLRTSAVNQCLVTTSGSAPLSGIPGTATIRAAYLYWAGSGSTPDLNVTFEATAISADRSFTESVGGAFPRDWFAGYEDVTAIVQSKVGGPNGTYNFSGLTVDNGGNHCTVATVLSGWSLFVIYEDAGEPLRVINLFDGLQNFWGSSIVLVPSNFQIPSSGIDGSFGVLTWEGDAGNSGSRNGLFEDLRFNGNLLINPPLNPNQNQYNSTISPLGINTSYGVDLDLYDVTPYLLPGQTSATTFYSTGQDRVLLTLEIVSVTNTPVADLAITKSHVGDFVAGQQGVYTISVSNNGPNNTDTNTQFTVTDTLPAGLSYVSGTGTGWSCGAVGQIVTCTQISTLSSGSSLPAISLTVDVTAAAAPSVTNNVTITSNSSTFDNVAANNSANDLTNVIVPDLSTSTKSVLDLNGGDANPGDTLRYTISITESAGGAVNNVSVTDAIDALLTNFVVTNNGGGTDNSLPGGPLNITAISVPASGTVTVEFEVDIVGTANPGDIISNTAVINNPISGVNTNAVAPNVIVSASSIPGTGVKPLYFGNVLGTTQNPTLPQNMSRVPLVAPSVPVRVRIRRQDAPRRWDLLPTLQASLGLSANPIPVVLQMRRNGNNSTRNIRVSIDYAGGAAGFWGCLDLAIPGVGATGLSNAVTRTFTFNVPQTDAACNPVIAVPIVLPAATTIRALVDNEPVVGPAGQAIFVYPFNDNVPDTSRVELPATTVINVDTVTIVDDVPFPGGTVQPTYAPNETVRVRTVVSDPFGHDDITSATIEILDPNAVPVVVAGTAMTEVAPLAPGTPGATKTYEYVFPVPLAGPTGYWTARIIANEGSEGTITDLGVNTFRIEVPTLSIMKLTSAYSDPVNNPSYPGTDAGANPKSIPGAIIEYQVIVTNTGAGRSTADSIVITDPLSANLTLFFGSPIDPIQFVDGATASGLTFTFTNLADGGDDVDFSNDGGATFITPTVDVNGFDTTVPAINYIRINPKGVLNGSLGSGDPSFTLIFRGRVQ